MSRFHERAKRVVRGAAHRAGLELSRYRPEHLLYARRAAVLRERGIGIALDVGANTGQFAGVLRADGYRGRIVSFEPLPEAFAELARKAGADPAWECRPLALAARDGEAELHRAANSQSSSLLPMHKRHAAAAPRSAYVGSERVTVARLDSLREELARPGDRVYLKLDVQGYELPVLRGATETLAQVEAVECELSLAPLYEGQALFPEVLEHLERAGFDLVLLERVFNDARTGRLLQLDGLFLRQS